MKQEHLLGNFPVIILALYTCFMVDIEVSFKWKEKNISAIRLVVNPIVTV